MNNYTSTLKGEVKKNIELEIINGIYREGDMIPSLSKLQTLYSCGRNTAKTVLTELYEEDLITMQRGVGSYLKPFAKEKILKKYQQKIEEDIKKIIEEAYAIKMDCKVLDEFTREMIKEIYSRRLEQGVKET